MFYTAKQWCAAKRLGTFMGFVGYTVHMFLTWLENPVSWIILGLNVIAGPEAVVACIVTWVVIDVVMSAIVNLVAFFCNDNRMIADAA
ncbi:hypothetical protein SM033_00268 [Vibrio phage vB_VpaM_sm033]|nr:hypothetical protein SM033_00268 [Vibrio phage vB_VpaM_sm033]